MLDLGKLLAQIQRDLGEYIIEKIRKRPNKEGYMLEIWAKITDDLPDDAREQALQGPYVTVHAYFNEEIDVLVFFIEMITGLLVADDYWKLLYAINEANKSPGHGIRLAMDDSDTKTLSIICSAAVTVPTTLREDVDDCDLHRLVEAAIVMLLKDGPAIVEEVIYRKPLCQ